MAYFLEIVTLLALTSTCLGDVASGSNQYLPPSKGYNYDKPSVPFPTNNNNQQLPFPTTARPFTPPKPTYGPPITQRPYQQPPTYTPGPTYRPPVTQGPYRPPYNPPKPTPDYNGQPTGNNDHSIHHGGNEHDHHHHHEPGMPFDFNYAVKDDYYGNDYSHNAVSDGDVTRGEYRILLPDGRTQIVRYTADWKNGFNAQVTYEGTPTYPNQPQGSGSGLNPNYGAPGQQGSGSGNAGYKY